MAILELKEIGKIYATGNAIAVGIRRVNISMDKGEFVAITGKSGCGKTTLLNVMSGLDSYEEGEMFIYGEETSHFIESDWDQYRREYISFIFQDYNIIESFSVLHNVEFALTHIKSRKERRAKAIELVEKVGLTSVMKQKGSKLSGGQKQRTVIARALAKDSPIILADEPTGNLDSESAKSIIALLGEIAKEKLVVVVTHNIEELEGYATREIRIFDGEISSDEKRLNNYLDENKEINELTRLSEDTKEEDEVIELETEIIIPASKRNVVLEKVKVIAKNKALLNKEAINLGFRRYLSMPKLTSFVTVMCMVSVLGMALIISLLTSIGFASSISQNMFEPEEGRLIVASNEKIVVTDAEKDALANKYGATHRNRDVLADIGEVPIFYSINNQSYNYDSTAILYKYDEQKISIGRAPKASNEIMLRVPYAYKHIILSDDVIQANICFLDELYVITGCTFYLDNTIPAQVFLSDSAYGLTYKRSVLNKFVAKYYYVGDKVIISPGLTGMQSFNYFRNSSDLSFSHKAFLKYDVGEYALEQCPSITEDFDLYIVPMNNLYGETHSYDYKEGIYISEEKADEIMMDHDYQFSLLFKTDKEAKACIPELIKQNYSVSLSTAQKINPESEIDAKLKDMLTTLLWITSIVFIGIFLGLCSVRVHSSQKKDIAIFRTMGVDAKVIKVSMYWYNFIAILPCLLISTIIMITLFFTPAGLVFSYIQPWGFVALWTGLFGTMIVTTKIVNRKIFRETVRKNLKGGRKK